MTVKAQRDYSPLLKERGYEMSEVIYLKILGD